MEKLHVASITMNSRSDKALNVATAVNYIEKAADLGARWVLLPELFSFHGPYDDLTLAAEPESGPLSIQLSSLAQKLGITIFAGTVPELPESATKQGAATHKNLKTKVYNTLFAYSPSGEIIAKYRKIHLFNLRGEAGTPSYDEGAGFLPGDVIVTTMIDGWRVGFATCYDLRFPGFFYRMTAKQPVDIIIVPSAFTKKTGEAHWQLLLQARAVECQCFIFSSNQTGIHSPGKESFGHSMIIDPWGKIIANSHSECGIIDAVIQASEIASTRAKLPALENRRHDVY
jgi:predicted amidohydrolase